MIVLGKKNIIHQMELMVLVKDSKGHETDNTSLPIGIYIYNKKLE